VLVLELLLLLLLLVMVPQPLQQCVSHFTVSHRTDHAYRLAWPVSLLCVFAFASYLTSAGL
jgi:hypothetical protein